MTDLTKPTAAIETGIYNAASRLGLKTQQSLTVAAASDPLAFQVGVDLGGRLTEGQPTWLPEVQACAASKPCVAGMEVAVIDASVKAGATVYKNIADGTVADWPPHKLLESTQRKNVPPRAKIVLSPAQ